MKLKSLLRAATVNDCPKIAQLFSIASDGVANYVWSTIQADYPGLSLIEIGTKRYAKEQTDFSYQNCVVVECNGEVIGMMVSFPLKASGAESEPNCEVANHFESSLTKTRCLSALQSPKTKSSKDLVHWWNNSISSVSRSRHRDSIARYCSTAGSVTGVSETQFTCL